MRHEELIRIIRNGSTQVWGFISKPVVVPDLYFH